MAQKAAQYLVKQRQFIERKRIRTPWFAGTVARYSPWVRIGSFNDLDQAAEFRSRRSLVGLQQTIVTIRGVTVIDATGALRVTVPGSAGRRVT